LIVFYTAVQIKYYLSVFIFAGFSSLLLDSDKERLLKHDPGITSLTQNFAIVLLHLSQPTFYFIISVSCAAFCTSSLDPAGILFCQL